MDMIDKQKVYCLLGPTAVGKTKIALELGSLLPIEIISVDSGMIYRGMDIGTAKPSIEELSLAPHHLIDICDPAESYSAGQFRVEALQKIQEIFARGKVPLLVGGTMLYFWILEHGMSDLPRSNEIVRLKIKQEKDQYGLDVLYERLKKIDPQRASQLQPTDSQRIQRALEVYELTGKSLSELYEASQAQSSPYTVVNFIIMPGDTASLHDTIEKRFKEMLINGLIEEVKELYKRSDLHSDLPSIRAVGYRQIWQYLSGVISYEKMLELVPLETRKLAKRQLTWLKKWQNGHVFENNRDDLLINIMNLISI
jgi:tRNA dimethylallyltransferase